MPESNTLVTRALFNERVSEPAAVEAGMGYISGEDYSVRRFCAREGVVVQACFQPAGMLELGEGIRGVVGLANSYVGGEGSIRDHQYDGY